jgi:hypothetical protein
MDSISYTDTTNDFLMRSNCQIRSGGIVIMTMERLENIALLFMVVGMIGMLYVII